jgi:hypothetical protein
VMICEHARINAIAEAPQQRRRTLDVSKEERERHNGQSLKDGRLAQPRPAITELGRRQAQVGTIQQQLHAQ